METIKTPGAEIWAGTIIGGYIGLGDTLPFAPGQTAIRMRLFSPGEGIPVRMVLNDFGIDSKKVETETLTTKNLEWENIVFDFSEEVHGTKPINSDYHYNKIYVFFIYGLNGSGETYCWDNISTGTLTSIGENGFRELAIVQNPVGDVLKILSSPSIVRLVLVSVSGREIQLFPENDNIFDVSRLDSGY